MLPLAIDTMRRGRQHEQPFRRNLFPASLTNSGARTIVTTQSGADRAELSIASIDELGLQIGVGLGPRHIHFAASRQAVVTLAEA